MSSKSRSSELKIDSLNLRILENLQSCGRIAINKLSENIGLSPSPCLGRVRRLEDAGVIEGYWADINLAALGPYVMVLANVTLNKNMQHQDRQFCKLIADIPEIVAAYQISGPYDYQLAFVCRDINNYQQIAKELLSDDGYVTRLESHVVLNVVKRFRGYPLRQIAAINDL